MSETQTALVLASSSPRRRDLLGRLHVAPTRIASPDIDETPRKGEVPRVYALRMAVEKARAVERLPGEIVIAGDTTWPLAAACSTRRDAEDVRAMLGKLAGRRHRVFAGVRNRCTRAAEIAPVRNHRHLQIAEPGRDRAYVASGEGLGKAGGYAIQGLAEALIRSLSGSHSGVIGLPL
jgi:septum formation protein